MRSLVTVGFACAFVCAGVVACAGSKPQATSANAASSAPSTAAGPDGPHRQAIARLVAAPWGQRLDKRRTISLPLPDAAQWTHVKFFGVTTLAGWRYGDEHHAVVAAFTFDPPEIPASIEGCTQRFVDWGTVRANAFDLQIGDARVDEVSWPGARGGQASLVRIYVVDAQRRSVFGVSRYPSAYAIYPAWTDACLVVGVSVPEDDAGPLAAELRDRWVRDGLPALVAKPAGGSKALEAKTDVD